ncbi:uncharacterized protein LOC135211335 [Macrobrachium nipponense]|uniref:uncharacterized protein LOC135211335 n=1 Tax=Macrobrachium nipponense TaxID=159736 RepID=UPI0030C87845
MTPIHIVFDASARMDKQAPSLNDCLYFGPSLTGHLTDLLLKFRLDPFAVSADISKAFLRVGLQPSDHDYTRFIWLKDPNNEKDLQAYRFRSVLFGATCSPFLLQSTLQHHFETYPTSPEVSFFMTKFYVNNLIGSLPTTVSLYSLYKVAKEVLLDAGMPLREWISNDPTFNEMVTQEGDRTTEGSDLVKVHWNYKTDHLSIKPPTFEEAPLTKWLHLSNLSKVFDPLGLFAPIIIRAKVLMQKVWKLFKRWDEIFPPELQEEWSKIKEDLENISYQEFPRFTANRGTNYSLHIFCDASEKAYGAAAYLMDLHEGANLVFSKARVASLKKKSIPQLELTANYSAVKIADYFRTVFTTDGVKITDTVIWSDSKVALHWIQNNKSKNVYVHNRVNEISQVTEVRYLYVPGEENPADLVSRGISMWQFKKSQIWFHGPSWLPNPEMWPEQTEVSTCHLPETTEEVLTTVVSEEATCPIDIRRFASLPKLINVTKLVIKFTRLLKRTIENRKTKNTGPVNSENVEVQNSEALRILIGFTQSQYFPEEMSYLNKNSHKIPTRIKCLGLFLDESRLLRCTGRLQNVDHLPYRGKFPLLLPPNSPLTGLIVIQTHEKVLHAGVQDTICKVREEYWIPTLRQCVKKMKMKCHLCNHLEGPALCRPPPPPLPACRVNSLRPYAVTGVDLTGQILICNPATKEMDKVYIVVFTCTSTRACHLEVVKDLTSTAFLNSFRRFTARRYCSR